LHYKCVDRNFVEDLISIAERVLGNRFDHGYPHVVRVWKLAYRIVERENVDVDYCVLDASVLLHDIGRAVGEPHAYFSALLAKSLLLKRGFSGKQIDCAVNAILYHSFSYAKRHGIKPVCEEAKVLSDADKLDALGVNGFIRVFLYDPERSLNSALKHFEEKIMKLPDYMHYEYSRKLALELRNRTAKMLEWLLEENSE